ncbi:LOC100909680 [Phodopus roborovskii]|uniref:LOC100909680 protein n=1 Tax=Phodopus roborovskii TaxID=109678 RepID=A0AAU9YY82_PHORO|nr:LOC100909680 [Phodopus roborovskii]
MAKIKTLMTAYVGEDVEKGDHSSISVMTQLGLTEIYRTFHPNANNYKLFSAPHRTFSKIGHILSNKMPDKLMEIEQCAIAPFLGQGRNKDRN